MRKHFQSVYIEIGAVLALLLSLASGLPGRWQQIAQCAVLFGVLVGLNPTASGLQPFAFLRLNDLILRPVEEIQKQAANWGVGDRVSMAGSMLLGIMIGVAITTLSFHSGALK